MPLNGTDDQGDACSFLCLSITTYFFTLLTIYLLITTLNYYHRSQLQGDACSFLCLSIGPMHYNKNAPVSFMCFSIGSILCNNASCQLCVPVNSFHSLQQCFASAWYDFPLYPCTSTTLLLASFMCLRISSTHFNNAFRRLHMTFHCTHAFQQKCFLPALHASKFIPCISRMLFANFVCLWIGSSHFNNAFYRLHVPLDWFRPLQQCVLSPPCASQSDPATSTMLLFVKHKHALLMVSGPVGHSICHCCDPLGFESKTLRQGSQAQQKKFRGGPSYSKCSRHDLTNWKLLNKSFSQKAEEKQTAWRVLFQKDKKLEDVDEGSLAAVDREEDDFDVSDSLVLPHQHALKLLAESVEDQ